jgi:hypothetical protein
MGRANTGPVAHNLKLKQFNQRLDTLQKGMELTRQPDAIKAKILQTNITHLTLEQTQL